MMSGAVSAVLHCQRVPSMHRDGSTVSVIVQTVDSDFQEKLRAAEHTVAVVGKTEVTLVFDKNDTDHTGIPKLPEFPS